MEFVNLTPHAIVIYARENALIQEILLEVPTSGNLARCKEHHVDMGNLGIVPVIKTTYGEVDGLPDRQPNVIYIVSRMVKSAVPAREDVLCPGPAVRDGIGRIIGCRGLSI